MPNQLAIPDELYRQAGDTMMQNGASNKDVVDFLEGIDLQAKGWMMAGESNSQIVDRLSRMRWKDTPLFGVGDTSSPVFDRTAESTIAAAQRKSEEEIAGRPLSFGRKLIEVPFAYARGVANIPGTVSKAWDTLTQTPLSSNRPSDARQFVEGMVSGASQGTVGGVEDLANLVTLGRYKQLKDVYQGKDPYAASPKRIPPPPPIDTQAEGNKMLGEFIGMGLTGKPLYEGVKALVRPALAPFVTGNVLGAVGPLSQGDIIGAAQGAGTGGGMALGTQLGVNTTVGVARKIADAPYSYVLGKAAEKYGGASGILESALSQIRRPSIAEGQPPPLSVEAGQRFQQQASAAERYAHQYYTDTFNNTVLKLVPDNVTRKNTAVKTIADLANADPLEGPLSTATEKRLGRIARGLSTSPEDIMSGVGSEWAAVRDKIKKAVDVQGVEGKDLSWKDLLNVKRRLNEISTNDRAGQRLLKLAGDAVDRDIEGFGRMGYPDAVKSYNWWKEGYAQDVGQNFGANSPLAPFIAKDYNVPKMAPDDVIQNLLTTPRSRVDSSLAAIRKWGPVAPELSLDGISVAAFNDLVKKSLDVTNQEFVPGKFVRNWNEMRDAYEPLLGARTGPTIKLVEALKHAGLEIVNMGDPRVLRFSEAYHVLRGGGQIGAGNPMGFYHLGQAIVMKFAPQLFQSIFERQVGKNLLREGVMDIQTGKSTLLGPEGPILKGPPPPPPISGLLPPGNSTPPRESSPGTPIYAEPNQFASYLSESSPVYQIGVRQRGQVNAAQTPNVIQQGTGQRQLPPGTNPPARSAEIASQTFRSQQIKQEAANMLGVEQRIQSERDLSRALLSGLNEQFPARGAPRADVRDPHVWEVLDQMATNANDFPQAVRRQAANIIERFSPYRPVIRGGLLEPPGPPLFIGPTIPRNVLPLTGSASNPAAPNAAAEVLSRENPVTNLARVRDRLIKEGYTNQPKASKVFEDAQRSPRGVVANEVKISGGKKILVSSGELKSFNEKTGGLADRWFTDDRAKAATDYHIEDLQDAFRNANFIDFGSAERGDIIAAIGDLLKKNEKLPSNK